MKRLLFSFIFFFSLILAYSQRTAKVSATYTYYASESMSVEEAKRIALERAKIQAIADEFGTVVSQSNSIVVSNKNGVSEENFYSYGGTDVKGEWIETIGEPKYDISHKEKTLIVTCAVKGKAREISSAVIEFVAKPLRNGTDLRFESTSFKNGDDLYLYFQSPIDGFLAVYLLDEATQTVYCILPYKKQKDITAFSVKSNTEYIFFSKNAAEREDRVWTDEYSLSCDSDKEFNTLYVLFSQYEIGKRTGFNNTTVYQPNNISYKAFKQWLSKILSRDNNIQFQEIYISISK